MLLRCHTATLPCCYATTLPRYHTTTLPHCYTAVLLRCHAATLLCCYAAVLLRCCTATLSRCHAVTLLSRLTTCSEYAPKVIYFGFKSKNRCTLTLTVWRACSLLKCFQTLSNPFPRTKQKREV